MMLQHPRVPISPIMPVSQVIELKASVLVIVLLAWRQG